MRMWSDEAARSRSGPPLYYGYCNRSGRYRMMNLPDYIDSMQEGMNKWVNDAQTTYQNYARSYSDPTRAKRSPCCESARDCHCECCVCDSDILVHARCGERRSIPITFDNETRRDRDVKLELEKFVTSGGRDLNWRTALSETHFTLRPCGEHTVIVSVEVQCGPFAGSDAPTTATNANAPGDAGRVDRCEVAYAGLRADGCAVRPILIAVAVLPNDCDAYRCPCGGCCCN
jgi:hypothetical protein